MQLAGKPTAPRDCLLAFSIPTSPEAFVRDLSLGDRKDFARHVIGGQTADDDRQRQLLFESSAYPSLMRIIDEVCQTIEHWGVQVVRDVRLTDLSNWLSSPRTVITLVTHFKPSVLSPEDILDVVELEERIFSSDHPVSSILRHAMGVALPRQSGMTAGLRRDNLADRLNQVVQSLDLRPNCMARSTPDYSYSQVERALSNRRILDQTYAGLIRPGNRVEFADGLHSLEDVVAHIPTRADAILDLTICNSNLLGELIKAAHSEWQVMSNEEATSLKFRLIFYKYRMKKLTVKPINYIDADLELRLELLGRR